ncbi:MAG: insulinase family protein [Syntrophaceae bacterium]|nr:insulinase family protein [Pseudomonadota bacterium]MCG2742200.1 insulinase family protein [Syntrophaceae bacterium]
MKLKFSYNPRPLRNLEIESRKRALEIFRGTLPPQRSARKDDCLSAKREFRLCSEARRSRVEKCPARGGITIFKGINSLLIIISLSLILGSAGIASAASPTTLPDPDHIRYKPLSFEPPRAERLRLENGMLLYILPDKELPLVNIKVVVRTGSMYDPAGREGVAELTADLMGTGGVAGMSGDAVDETLESMAATFDASVNRESGNLSFSVLKKDLDLGFDLFSRILTQPSFEEMKLTLAKDLKLEELRRIMDDPQKLAFREFGRLMHGGSPRGRVTTSASIRSIQRDDLLGCHKLFYHPENMMIAISGDIDIPEAKTLVERYLGGWNSSERRPETPPLPRQQDGGIYFLTKDVPQSIVIFGWLAPAKRDAQFYPFEVLDFIIGGGGFRSRIFQEIRTNLGLAYSTGSFYKPKGDYGLFGAYALTKSASTVQVISRIREIFREMGQKPVSPEELEGAKRAILNSFIFSFTSAEKIAFRQMMIEYESLPDDYLLTYRSKIESVTAADIRDTVVRLGPKRETLLIVGNDYVYREIAAKFGKVFRVEAKF